MTAAWAHRLAASCKPAACRHHWSTHHQWRYSGTPTENCQLRPVVRALVRTATITIASNNVTAMTIVKGGTGYARLVTPSPLMAATWAAPAVTDDITRRSPRHCVVAAGDSPACAHQRVAGGLHGGLPGAVRIFSMDLTRMNWTQPPFRRCSTTDDCASCDAIPRTPNPATPPARARWKSCSQATKENIANRLLASSLRRPRRCRGQALHRHRGRHWRIR